jgi:hypothetical protein
MNLEGAGESVGYLQFACGGIPAVLTTSTYTSIRWARCLNEIKILNVRSLELIPRQQHKWNVKCSTFLSGIRDDPVI